MPNRTLLLCSVITVVALAGAGCDKATAVGAKEVGAHPKAYAGQTLRSTVTLGGYSAAPAPQDCFFYDPASAASEVQAFVLRAPDNATFEKLQRLDKAAGSQGVVVTYKVN